MYNQHTAKALAQKLFCFLVNHPLPQVSYHHVIDHKADADCLLIIFHDQSPFDQTAVSDAWKHIE